MHRSPTLLSERASPPESSRSRAVASRQLDSADPTVDITESSLKRISRDDLRPHSCRPELG